MDDKIMQALRQADDIAISEEVDCFDVLNYIEDLRNKNKALVAHNAICTLLDATRKLLEQGSSKGGVWIKTGDQNDTYSILIQKEGLGRPIDALDAKIDSLSSELGQATAYIDGLEYELKNLTVAKEAAERDKAMSKSVLISIQPKWCELIASGKKTIDVRKTAPKDKEPFKVYIYQTKKKWIYHLLEKLGLYQGKVIGEFVCDKVENIMVDIDENDHVDYLVTNDFLSNTCLSFNEICRYLRNSDGYGWHISDLKIYDKPKELGEFYRWKKCDSCKMSGYEATACMYDIDCKVPARITRPPQSWMYVEERQ